MLLNDKHWKRLLLCCAGIFAGTAFCMKWMEPDFVSHQAPFTILGLELTYTKDRVVTILSGLDDHVRTILRYHLVFDFAFMAGVYPGIAAICMIVKRKLKIRLLQQVLTGLAILQLAAWGCDIAENSYLLKWISDPSSISGFTGYHLIVAAKWILALAGILMALLAYLFFRKK